MYRVKTMSEKTKIPMSSPSITALEREAVQRVLSSPVLSIGPQVEAFESAVCDYLRVPYAAAVNSGTSGLHLAVIAAGVRDRNLVVTTPFSFVASANCILYQRAVPVFVDVDEKTGNMDARAAAQAVELLAGGAEFSKIKHLLPTDLRQKPGKYRLGAVLPVHAFGQPVDMDPVLTSAAKYGIPVIEDACEALGSSYKNKKAGCLGDAGVFAFYPNKQITTGEGGMIVTRKKEWLQQFVSMRNQGRDLFNAWLVHDRLGYNYRMDEMSAALGAVQMQRIEDIIRRRDRVAGWYNQRLAGCPSIEIPRLAPSTTRMSWFVYVIRVLPPLERDRMMARLQEEGIPSRPYFTPIHLQPFYRQKFGFAPGDFPVTEKLGNQCLALPFSTVMEREQVDRVCDHLLKAAGVAS